MPSRILIFAAVLLLAGAIPCPTAQNQEASGLVAPARSMSVVVGDYLYVSGQSANLGDGSISSDVAAQLTQCLENVRRIVESEGFSVKGLVYSQVYVRDPRYFPAVERAWAGYFPQNGPARSLIGVTGLAGDSAVEVSAVAYRVPTQLKAILLKGNHGQVPDAVLTPQRAYLSDSTAPQPGDPASEVRQALEQMDTVLRSTGLDLSHLVFVNPYLTAAVPYESMNQEYAKRFEFGNTPARATIQVHALPNGHNVAFTGVAVRDKHLRLAVRPKNMPPSPTASPCVFTNDTFYCSAKSGFIPGPLSGIYDPTIEGQLRQTMRNLLDGLEEAGLTLENVVAAHAYLDNVADLPKFNRIYRQYFGKGLPALTVVQQIPSVDRKVNNHDQWPPLEQISIVAVKGHKNAN